MKIFVDKKLLDVCKPVIERAGHVCTDNQADAQLLLVENISKELYPTLFVVITEKHQVENIGKICSGEHHARVRGFFLEREIESAAFKALLENVARECSFRDVLVQSSQNIRRSKEFTEIGSLVELGKKHNRSERSFTSLFIDPPMLRLTSQINQILDILQDGSNTLKRQYQELINEIRNNKIIVKDSYSPKMLRELEKGPSIGFEPVLLTGETGVGKTLVARWIHRQSNLPGTLQELNASGLSPHLLESELFGHVKGTFTDAKTDKPGKALLAYGGVLFLDEIGDMPLELQPRVMKFIDEQSFTPEGWFRSSKLHTPVLIVAATNKDLQEEVRKGSFREDLYARFRKRIRLPSIEERKGSLHVLVDLLLQQFGEGKVKYIANTAMERFRDLTYEDNFRGLERTVREAVEETVKLGLDMILPEVVSYGGTNLDCGN
jgi:DNA-binding NtrC family response regulator